MKRISKTEITEMRSHSKKNRIMFAFTLPTVILYTIFFLVTMLIGVYYSFTDWNGISKDYTFVGLKNYVKVLTDERFREALWFNIGYTIALVVLLIVIPLTIALALNRIRRLSTLFRSIYFIPAVISMVTVGLIWNELFYRAVPFVWHRMPGFGDTNWRDIISILRSNGYEDDICIEGYHDPVYRGELEMTGQLHALNYLKWCRGGEFTPTPWEK